MNRHGQITKLFVMRQFSQILNRVPFSKITVKQIVRQSMIHRNTFYNHFSDKYELLNQFLTHFIGPILLNLNYRKFNRHPFQTLVQMAQTPLDDVTMGTLLKFQMSDTEFSNTVTSFMFNFILGHVNNSRAIWTIGQMNTVLLWNEFTGQHYDTFNDYRILDRIIQTKKFPGLHARRIN